MRQKPTFPVLSYLGIMVIFVVFSSPVFGQFNGNFDIERHYLDEENFLDWKAYQHPVSWRYAWYKTKNGMQTTVGSLSQERFLFNHEIHLETDISPFFAFLYEQKSESFFAPDPIYQEGAFRLGTNYFVAVIGFPQTEKKLSNYGVAIGYGRRWSMNYIRLSHLKQYPLFNETSPSDNNKGKEKFSPYPTMDRFELRVIGEQHFFLDLDLKRENPTRLHLFDPDQVKEYSGHDYNFTLDWFEWDRWLIGISAKSDMEERSHSMASPSLDLPDLHQKMELQWTDVYFAFRLSPGNFFTLGVLDSRFENRITSNNDAESEYHFKLTTTQPYAFWEHNMSNRLQWIFSLQGGKVKLDKYKGEEIEAEKKIERIDFKSGISLVFTQENTYRFMINTTWDMDLISERKWGGGNIQMQLYF